MTNEAEAVERPEAAGRTPPWQAAVAKGVANNRRLAEDGRESKVVARKLILAALVGRVSR